MLKIVAIIETVVIVVLGFMSYNYYNTVVSLSSQLSAAEYAAKQATNESNVAKSSLITANNNIEKLNSDISTYQLQITNLNNDKNIMQSTITALQTNVTALQGQVVALTKKLQGTLPYASPTGTNLKTTNQDNVHNPTWAELKSFLVSDSTDQLNYVLGSFVCGDFAQIVHNKAELSGIRCAMVVISFMDGSNPHALNAFMTSDKGLVYIDDTGQTPTSTNSCKYDAIGYVVVGQPYGSTDINFIIGLSYSDYVSLKNTFNKYQSDTAILNDLIKKFEVMPMTNASAAEVLAAKNQIESEIVRLRAIKGTLPSCWRGEMGIVKTIEVFW
ncbi:MAG: hypothetical protein WC499_04950 [Patescibacteria group bacterium]